MFELGATREEIKDSRGLLSDDDPANSSLVEVLEDKHEMFRMRGNVSQDMDRYIEEMTPDGASRFD